MNVVEASRIVKKFGDYAASNNIDLKVPKGSIFGLLGPNGAGKTTMIRMITNILIPDSGELLIFSEKASSNSQNKIGYLPEERGLYKKIKVIEQLVYFGRLKNMTSKEATKSALDWLNKLDAGDWENKKIQELSKGMQQKVQFIGSIMHSPELIILDEPFSGLDPVNAEILISVIHDLKKSGKTIILSTHVMEQAEKLCDEICLINKGKIALKGSLREIKRNAGKRNIILEFDGSDEFLNQLNGIKFLSRAKSRVEFAVDPAIISPKDILKKAIDNVEIVKFEIAEPGLHEIFIDSVTKLNSEK